LFHDEHGGVEHRAWTFVIVGVDEHARSGIAVLSTHDGSSPHLTGVCEDAVRRGDHEGGTRDRCAGAETTFKTNDDIREFALQEVRAARCQPTQATDLGFEHPTARRAVRSRFDDRRWADARGGGGHL
jgi:hypothetical protein